MEESMHNLADIQTWMQHMLIAPENNSLPGDAAAVHVTPSATLTPAQRLAIYQRGYYARLLQCMQGQYKALCHALGQELFDDFAREYLRRYPSEKPTLALLGARFPGFLSETRPDQGAEEREAWVDFMIDLARFEWDLYVAFDAPGHEGNPYAKAGEKDDSLRLQPCFSLHRYYFPVSGYYSAVAAGQDPEIPAPENHWVAIVRKNYRTAIFTLLEPQYTFLIQMQAGASVDRALAFTAAKYRKPHDEAQEAWTAWKKGWTEAGFFVTV